ncbi:MAG: hypothetical protein A2498_14120 [Lentisphaerae bacterium RIFOXYC12_FULL_60_16]|nr:MAG: hypothetical protein A2498_14120 [Lentisphaerae bacterium RIFOXYC12_FULL_60_16]OGV85860.1 MAG: hypothetical protein A2340_00725 [Lentisphaerae bacterium RIFOXYB12_FULL_60_10]
MKRPAFRIVVIVSWLAAMALLARRELLVEYFAHTLRGYRSLVSGSVLLSDSWMRLIHDGVPIGYSHTNFEINQSNPVRHLEINNRMLMRMTLLGESRTLSVESTAALDALNHLHEFTFELSAQGYRINVLGRRFQDNQFDVTIRSDSTRSRTRITIPDDVVIFSPMTEMMLRRMAPGDHVTFRALDPATLSTLPVLVSALRNETITIGDQSHHTTVLRSEVNGMEVTTWIDKDGRTIRQVTPLWTMEQCTPDEAFASLRDDTPAPDFIRRMAVPLDGILAAPRERPSIRMELQGVTLDPARIASSRQVVESTGPTGSVLTVYHGDHLPAHAPLPVPDAALTASTPFIQADDPAMRKQADAITRSTRSTLEAVDAITGWVHENMEKTMRITMPSALDILKTLAGDCNEHTYLAVGLARAAGIPADIKVGLAFHEDRFFYHAWPAFYTDGAWIETDPTWGQRRVDATHLALVSGEMASQVELVRLIGRLRIRILEGNPP